MTKTIVTPRSQTMPARQIVGLSRPYKMGQQQGIPAQWAEFDAAGAPVGDLAPQAWYGVCYDFDDAGGFHYLCGMEARSTAGLPPATAQVSLPAGDYAIFQTTAHISQMPAIWAEIFSVWLASPDWQARPGPSAEHYPPEFDSRTGLGGFEIWVPVA